MENFNLKTNHRKKIAWATLIVLSITFAVVGALLSRNINSACASQNSELYNKLSQLDGVHDIQPIETEKFQEKYIFEITQPLDWNNPNGQKIDQRVIISFNGFDKYNVVETEGYQLKDRVLTGDWSDEFVDHYAVNQINIEHRFFGDSVPDGLNNKDTKYWEFLTCENQAKDTHRIYTELAKILPNKWIASGASKGGETTMLYGYFFPNDMDVLVPYVAPWSVPNDPRAFDFIWNTAGDERYGTEQAAEYRSLMDQIMVDFYTHYDELYNKFETERADNIFYVKDVFGERSTKILYDQLILDVPYGTWQYDQDFENIQKIHDMNWSTQHDEKIESLLNLISDPATNKLLAERMLYKTANGENVPYPHYAYEFQAWEEQGNYYCDMNHLRTLLTKHGLADKLSIQPGEEVDLFAHLFVHKSFTDKFPYNPKTHNGLINWWNNTDQKIMAIYGSSDPWYALRINDIFNKQNIKIFVSNKEAHGAKINNLSDAETAEAWATLDSWLTDTPENPETQEIVTETAATSDSNTLITIAAFALLLISASIVLRKNYRLW